MQLSPREKDKLLVAMAAMVARRRLERGVKLNYPEAVALITDFVVEGARDGRSVTVHQPIRGAYDTVRPGEVLPLDGELTLNEGREAITLTVANTGDRPIQVGSHYHFFETNPALRFEREKARGMRLDIPAGTAVRFEPGQSRQVRLIALSGSRTVYGFRLDVMGSL